MDLVEDICTADDLKRDPEGIFRPANWPARWRSRHLPAALRNISAAKPGQRRTPFCPTSALQ
jgi:hypothetical protein